MPQDSRSRVERVADYYRNVIRTGELAGGDPLPPEQDVADEHGVSRTTVRLAFKQLEHEGLVWAGRGRGRHVRHYDLLVWQPGTFEHQHRRGDQPGSGQDAWAAEVTAQGRRPRQEVEPGLTHAPAIVAEQLGVETGATVVVRRRVRFVDDVPHQLADSYYPRDIAEGTPIMEPGDVTIPGGLMAAVGHQQVRFRDEITVRMPTPEEADRLDLLTGTAVAQHVRTGFDQADRPVRAIITIVPGDRHKIVYDVSAT